MRILLVKLSSLGDVVHNFPVATDIKRAYPDATIDWVTEAAYADLVALHPSVSTVYPVHLRALKAAWWQPARWSQFFDDKAALSRQRYDWVIDTQGLVKSAIVGNWATSSTSMFAGYDRDSIREPLAARWYQRTAAVSRAEHAVARNRALAASLLGYSLPSVCDYGLSHLPTPTQAIHSQPYVVLLHATSRADKQWSTANWVALGNALNAKGFAVLLPAGNAQEFATSQQIAGALANARALAPQSLPDTATMLAGASAVVGVDTGLAHLAVALDRPTVGLYITTTPKLTGLYDGSQGGAQIANLGGGTREMHAKISVESVETALKSVTESAL
jgi:heptosyltransferase I